MTTARSIIPVLSTIASAVALGLVVAKHVPALHSGGAFEWAVPWFFLASGYWMATRFEGGGWSCWRRETAKRVRSLLVPYFLWNLLWFPVLFAANLLGSRLFGWPRIIDGSAACIVRCLGLDPFAWPALVPTWFLRSLFIVAVLTGAVWTITGPRRTARLLFAALASLAWIALCMAGPLPGGLDGLLRFTFNVQGFAFFSLGGAIASFLPPGRIAPPQGRGGLAWRLHETLRPLLMPVFLLHVPVIVPIGWAAKALHVYEPLKSTAGSLAMWCIGVGGAALAAHALRRFLPRTAKVLFGGR